MTRRASREVDRGDHSAASVRLNPSLPTPTVGPVCLAFTEKAVRARGTRSVLAGDEPCVPLSQAQLTAITSHQCPLLTVHVRWTQYWGSNSGAPHY